MRGLVPPRTTDVEEQEYRVLRNYRKCTTDLNKYIFLTGLQDRNETLFYDIVRKNVKEMAPILYTPTVGLACK